MCERALVQIKWQGHDWSSPYLVMVFQMKTTLAKYVVWRLWCEVTIREVGKES